MDKLIKCTIFLVLFLNLTVYSQQVKIGVALPLFEGSEDNNQKELGNDILNGIKFSLEENNKNGLKIVIDVKDTKKDPETSARIFSDFGADKDIISVLGPVYSSELAAVLGVAANEKLPILSPTATGDDLAEDNEYVFQLNPTYKVRGKIMANYLIKEMGLKNFAIISEENYGVNFAKHFETEVLKLGGKVVFTEYYKSKADNIASTVKKLVDIIRENDLFINFSNLNLQQQKKFEKSGIRSSLIDSLISSKIDVSIYYLLGKDAKKIIDTFNVKPFKLKDETSKFLQGYIDAIYVPISNSNEIGMIVPSLFSDGLNHLIAGTGDWNNEKALEENKVYLKSTILESEYFPDENSERVKDLIAKVKKSKYKYNKYFLFGYDAMNYLAFIISNGHKTREQINQALNTSFTYNGIKSKFTVDYNRINSELNILRYDNGIKLTTQYKLPIK